jgi:lipopolysaccharide export system protein LptC
MRATLANLPRRAVDRWTAWSPALLLGALAALTWWLDAQVQAPVPHANANARHDPDLFLTNFRAERFDERGQVREALTAERAEHHPDDGSVDFVRPTLTLTAPEQPQFTVTALQGWISGDQDVATFRGNVQADRAASVPGQRGPSAGPMRLTSDFLRVFPDDERVETDQPVTIEEPRGIIRGVGMDFDNRTRMLHVKSGVRGSFFPGTQAK